MFAITCDDYSNSYNNNQGRFTHNSTQYHAKGKGREKRKGKFGNTKGKGKGRGKGKYSHGDKNQNEKQEPKVTNSSQKVTYLDLPTNGEDDETTIVFTQNMNRITRITDDEKPIQASEEGQTNNCPGQNENQASETTQAYRHARCLLCAKPVSSTNLNNKVALLCVECKQEQEGQEITDKMIKVITNIIRTMTTLPHDH